MLASGGSHMCVLIKSSKKLRCFGQSLYGALGSGESVDYYGSQIGEGLFPPSVNLGTGLHAVKLYAGYRHTCAILNDGRLELSPVSLSAWHEPRISSGPHVRQSVLCLCVVAYCFHCFHAVVGFFMRFGTRKYHEQKDILLVKLRPKVLGLEF